MMYRAEFEDNEIEVFSAASNSDALLEAYAFEKAHGTAWSIILLDEDYNEIMDISAGG